MKKDRDQDEPERSSRGPSSRSNDQRGDGGHLSKAAGANGSNGKSPRDSRVKGDYSSIKASQDAGKFASGARDRVPKAGASSLPDKTSSRAVPSSLAANSTAAGAKKTGGAARASAVPSSAKQPSSHKGSAKTSGGKGARARATTTGRKRRSTGTKVLGVLAFLMTFFLAMVAGFLWIINLPPAVNLASLAVSSQPSSVYDRFGNLMFTIPAQGPQTVPLSDIPVRLQNALIATEDAGFYQHKGFSMKGYVRAAWEDILHRNESQGASTITQQLAKFVYLSDAKTFSRKLEQLLLAVQIARKYTKSQVLDMYFNRVYFGNGATGIAQAAYSYFGLEPDQMHQMTLEQCALLAGLPQAPSLYDPLVNPNLAITRRNEVLGRMLTLHYISQSVYAKAVASGLELHPMSRSTPQIPQQYDYVRDYVETQLANLHLGNDLSTGGLKIYTSIDPTLQEATYQEVNNPYYYPTPLSSATEKMEGSAVFIDPHTGGIEALVGGLQNQYTPFGFDYATGTERSPGSAMKPLVVYGPAIQTGKWNANSALLDGKNNSLSFGNYTVSDWESHYTVNGYVTLRYALAESWNSPAVWLLDQIGIPTGIAFAEKAGINLQSSANDNLTIALGNVHPGISPLILADAYCSFDNGGVRIPAHMLERVVGSNGATVYQNVEQPITVMSPSTAMQMVALLENNVVNGIVAGAAAPGHQVAGKTGSVAFTNQSHTDSDLWVAAFTPNVVGAIWEGYPDTTLANSVPQWSSKYPPEMFSGIIRAGLPAQGGSFNVPPAAGPDYP